MSGQITLGVIGTGAMAAQMTGALQGTPGVRVTTVLSGDAARAEGFARRFGLTGGTSDQAAFLTLNRPDAVYVGSANAAHFPAALACVQAGLPVLVEKPLTTQAADTAALLAAGRAAGVLVMENLWTLCLPSWQAAKTRIAAGDLGAPCHLSFDFSYPVSPAAMPNLFDAETGGVLLDRAVYGLAHAVDLLGDCTGITAAITRDAAGVDTRAALQLTHAGGATAQITVSLTSAGPAAMEIGLEQGHIRLGPPAIGAEALTVSAQPLWDGPRADPLIAPGRAAALKDALKAQPALRRLKRRLSRRGETFHGFGASGYGPVAAHFADLVRGGRSDSDLVPGALSETVAGLVQTAHQTDRQTGRTG